MVVVEVLAAAVFLAAQQQVMRTQIPLAAEHCRVVCQEDHQLIATFLATFLGAEQVLPTPLAEQLPEAHPEACLEVKPQRAVPQPVAPTCRLFLATST